MAIISRVRKAKRPTKRTPDKPVGTKVQRIERLNRKMEDAIGVHLFDGVRKFKGDARDMATSDKMREAFRDGKYEQLLERTPYDKLHGQLDLAADKLGGLAPQTRKELRRGIQGGFQGKGTSDRALTNVIDFKAALDGGPGTPGPKRNAFHRAARRIDDRGVKLDLQADVKVKTRAYMTKILMPEKKVIFETVRAGLKAGRSPASISNEIISRIGLTKRQGDAVARAHAKNLASGMTEAQAEKLRDEYAERLLKYRADTIAITETRTLSETIKTDEWMGLQKDGILGANPTVTWLLGALDDKTCPVCIEVSNTTMPLGEPFQLSNGIECLPGFAHPRCRCHSMLTTDDDPQGSELPNPPGQDD